MIPKFVRWAVGAALATVLLVAGLVSFPALAHQRDGTTHRDSHSSAATTDPAATPAPAPPAADPPTCRLTVPSRPLTAKGLATPYLLTGCAEATNSVFVEATVVSSITGALSVYRPLVIDAGTTPAVAPVPVTLPPGAVVGIWVGSNANVHVVGPGAGSCVDGLRGSIFGQEAMCNGPAFFAVAQRRATIPALGVGRDGLACPTVRSFSIVDQDQSDNVITKYRLLPDGRTAQDTAANAGLGGTIIRNGSDEGLLAGFVDPALGCTPFTAPDLTNPGHQVGSLALNELSATRQANPVALVPLTDPMVLVGGQPSRAKNALYRLGVGQNVAANPDGRVYCANLTRIAPPRIALDQPFTQVAPSPDPAVGATLYSFLTARYQQSIMLLGCNQ